MDVAVTVLVADSVLVVDSVQATEAITAAVADHNLKLMPYLNLIATTLAVSVVADRAVHPPLLHQQDPQRKYYLFTKNYRAYHFNNLFISNFSCFFLFFFHLDMVESNIKFQQNQKSSE